MTNPGRPVDNATIDTAWGLAVADTVVRRFPNVASRDADLADFTAADLLGQVVVLTDSGQVQQFAGPVLRWARPWGLPWGHIIWTGSTYAVADIGSGQVTAVTTPVVTVPSGRHIRHAGRIVSRGNPSGGWGASIYTDGFPLATGVSAGGPVSIYGEVVVTYGTAKTEERTLYAFGLGCSIEGGTAPGNMLTVADVGPYASPTALEVGGWINPTDDEPVAGIVDEVDHAELLACSLGELPAALAELNVDTELYNW